MRLTNELKSEFKSIQARLQSIFEGEYLDRSTGILGEKFPEMNNAELFMGPLQRQEQGCPTNCFDTLNFES